MILVNLRGSSGQVYKQALCVEFPSSFKSRLIDSNTPRNHAPPDSWKDQPFLPHIHELVLREGPQISLSWTQRPTDLSAAAAVNSALECPWHGHHGHGDTGASLPLSSSGFRDSSTS